MRPVGAPQVLHAGDASPPNTPGNVQEAARTGYRCNLPSAPSRTSISTAFLVPTSRYSDARGARAAGAVPLTSAVCTGGYHGARRRERLAQYDPARTESLALLSAAAPAPAAGATAELRRQWTPRCSEVEGRDVMRCFYAQHGSTGTLRGGRWGATRPLRCGASRCSCRRSSRPAPGSSDYIHLDYMLPTLFGARRDHMLAMT